MSAWRRYFGRTNFGYCLDDHVAVMFRLVYSSGLDVLDFWVFDLGGDEFERHVAMPVIAAKPPRVDIMRRRSVRTLSALSGGYDGDAHPSLQLFKRTGLSILSC